MLQRNERERLDFITVRLSSWLRGAFCLFSRYVTYHSFSKPSWIRDEFLSKLKMEAGGWRIQRRIYDNGRSAQGGSSNACLMFFSHPGTAQRAAMVARILYLMYLRKWLTYFERPVQCIPSCSRALPSGRRPQLAHCSRLSIRLHSRVLLAWSGQRSQVLQYI